MCKVVEEYSDERAAQAAQQKAVEDAIMLINDYKETPEVAARKMNAPLNLVLEELQKEIKAKDE